MWNLVILVLGAVPLLASAQKACYFPDGTVAENDFPCYKDADISFCCGPGYACLKNRICKRTEASLDGVASPIDFVRGSCTNSDWSSTACPAFCTGDGFANGGGNTMFNCSVPTEYCCYGGTVDCSCDDPSLVSTLKGGEEALTTVGEAAASSTTEEAAASTTGPDSSSATPTEDATSSSSSFSTNAPTSPAASAIRSSTDGPRSTATRVPRPANSGGGGTSSNTKIGVGVGVPVGAAILAVIAYLLWRERRNRKHIKALASANRGKSVDHTHLNGEGAYYSQAGSSDKQPDLHEIEGRSLVPQPVELDHTR
ncbi:MAG: hypothetical protein M1825_006148 [Sarcosagium campestre]|nr:MAG: hypothetical protein M1825_006148 [Sarcosagium campestre]